VSRLALISDIHGNCVALDAVLADLANRAVDEICLGDLAAGGPQPAEVVGRLRELDCQVIRGNADNWLLDGLPAGRSEETRRLGEVVAWVREQLAADDLDYLAALQPTTTISVADGLSLFCFHGSPRADIDSLLATTAEHELDELFAAAPQAHVFAGGHSHRQLLRPYRQSLLVNPGSVGLPLGSLVSSPGAPPLPSWAEYALVEVDGADVEVTFRRVAVDVAPLAAATEPMPHSTWAGDLERRIERWNAKGAA
jgi:predicted phosphodiesterase